MQIFVMIIIEMLFFVENSFSCSPKKKLLQTFFIISLFIFTKFSPTNEDDFLKLFLIEPKDPVTNHVLVIPDFATAV